MNQQHKKDIVEKVNEFFIPDISYIISLYSQEPIVKSFDEYGGYCLRYTKPLNKQINFINNFLCDEVKKDNCLNSEIFLHYIYFTNYAIKDINDGIIINTKDIDLEKESRHAIYSCSLFRDARRRIQFLYDLCYYPFYSQLLVEIRIRKLISRCERLAYYGSLNDELFIGDKDKYYRFINGYYRRHYSRRRRLECKNNIFSYKDVISNKNIIRRKCECEICMFSKRLLGEYFKE